MSYRGLLLHPGLYPFCLSTSDSSDVPLFQTWERAHKLNEHIRSHLCELSDEKKQHCPHPKCRQDVEAALLDHLEFVYCVSQGVEYGLGCKRNQVQDDHPEQTASAKKRKSSTMSFTEETSDMKRSRKQSVSNHDLESIPKAAEYIVDPNNDEVGEENYFQSQLSLDLAFTDEISGCLDAVDDNGTLDWYFDSDSSGLDLT